MRWTVVLWIVLATAACKGKGQAGEPQGRGVALWSGRAQGLAAAPDGRHVAFLVDVARPKEAGVPEGIGVGRLVLAETNPGGYAEVVGNGVSSVQGGFAFSADGGALVFLADYRHAEGAGTLMLAPLQPRGPAQEVAKGVTSWATSRDGKMLGFVSAGRLGLRSLAGGAAPSPSAVAVGSFEFAPAGRLLLYRERAAHGGGLSRLDLESGTATELARQVADYRWADAACPVWIARQPTGEEQLFTGPGCPRTGKLSESAQTFTVSPEGDRVGFITAPADPTSSYGDLEVIELQSGTTRPIGKRVSEYRFAPKGGAVAWLENYNVTTRHGKLALALSSGAPFVVAQFAQAFAFDPSGRWLAYLARNPKKMLTLEMHLVAVARDAEPRLVDEGVYGYMFSSDGERLAYKNKCDDRGRGCTVSVVDTAGGPPLALGKKIAGFEWIGRSKRLFLMPDHEMVGKAVDLIVFEPGGSAPVLLDTAIHPSPQVVGSSVAYVKLKQGAEGVYLAPL